MRRLSFLIAALLAAPALAAEIGSHGDPIAPILLWLAVILVAAKLGGELATRVGQPAVLGELLAGVVLGNLGLVGVSGLEFLKTDPSIEMLAGIGVLVLLFEVGLESTVAQMLKVGLSAFLVALLGVVTPFALGWGVGAWLLPRSSAYVHAFLGATLAATSVGISARVLKDLGRSRSTEARVILGAAIIDDVLGLMILTVVAGVIVAADQGESLSYLEIATTVGKAAVFLVGSLALGVIVSPRLFALASKLKARGVLLAVGLAFCFFLSWLASRVGLAAIVGAFAAGLILEETHYRDFLNRGEHSLEEMVHPISSVLVPIFFVLMGMRTDLQVFGQLGVLGLAGALTFAAIAGKQACSLGVIGTKLDRLSIGLGMIPRGEVGLIFANVGLGLAVHGERAVDRATYAAVVTMVIVTTLITPPALRWSFGRAASLTRRN